MLRIIDKLSVVDIRETLGRNFLKWSRIIFHSLVYKKLLICSHGRTIVLADICTFIKKKKSTKACSMKDKENKYGSCVFCLSLYFIRRFAR